MRGRAPGQQPSREPDVDCKSSRCGAWLLRYVVAGLAAALALGEGDILVSATVAYGLEDLAPPKLSVQDRVLGV